MEKTRRRLPANRSVRSSEEREETTGNTGGLERYGGLKSTEKKGKNGPTKRVLERKGKKELTAVRGEKGLTLGIEGIKEKTPGQAVILKLRG